MRSSARLLIQQILNLALSSVIVGAALLPLRVTFALPAVQNSSTADFVSALVGDWRGTSTCVVRESACRDEDSLYHFSALTNKRGAVSLKADKIVDGKPATMGISNCDLDAAKSGITCPLPSASLNFHVKGKEMTGTMTLSNGTLWRKLSLNKVK